VAHTIDAGYIPHVVDSHPSTFTKDSAASKDKRKDNVRIHLVPETLPALVHSRAAIVASGTATVEAALMETPFVMVYRVTGLTYLLGRSTVKVPHFAMVNLIAGREVVRELVQQDFTPESV